MATATSSRTLKRCRFCIRTFAITEHLHRHQRSHTGERPYRCTCCGKSYARSDVLLRHLRQQHGQLSPHSEAHFSGQVDFDIARNPFHVSDVYDDSFVMDHTAVLSNESTLACELERDASFLNSGTILGPGIEGGTGLAGQFNEVIQTLDLEVFCDSFQHQTTHLDLDGFVQSPSGSANVDLTWNDHFPGEFETLCSSGDLSPRMLEIDQESLQCLEFLVSDDSHSKIQRIWPEISGPCRFSKATIWDQILSHPIMLLDDEVPRATSPSTILHEEHSRWGMNDEVRDRLCDYYSIPPLHERTVPHTPDPEPGSANLPTANTLGICIDLFFSRFEPAMSLIRNQSFEARLSPPIILFPMILIGMTFLNTDASKSTVLSLIPRAVEEARLALTFSTSSKSIPNATKALVSSMLLLSLSLGHPKTKFLHTTMMLLNQTFDVAKQFGLFHLSPPSREIFIVLDDNKDTKDQWIAWISAETLKRVVASLITIDALYAHDLQIRPQLAGESVSFMLPCEPDLFNIPDHRAWMLAIRSGCEVATPITVYQENTSALPVLPYESSIQNFLAAIWIRISDVRHRSLRHQDLRNSIGSHIPAVTYAKDSRSHSILSLLARLMYENQEKLQSRDPRANSEWNYLNMIMLADLELLECAIGRSGPMLGRSALKKVAIWAQTTAARRAVLHAAQIYLILSRLKRSYTPWYHSELSLLSAGLVLGLYLLVNRTGENVDTAEKSPVELLEDVDWRFVGQDEEFGAANISSGHPSCKYAAFINKGGTFAWDGHVCVPGHVSSRRIFHEFSTLITSFAWPDSQASQIFGILSESVTYCQDYSVRS
ncbi:hypothetical protein IQ07DRAFT_648960 [Pyrenochaeta sp. DS3sAY3a]|nr:hypothetical protein IQ07DRAFT_648960 [Pyrenochaeta sp. DS3sAY3a]